MKNLIKKQILFYCLLLLMTSQALYAAKSSHQLGIPVQKEDYTTNVATSKRGLLVYGYCRTYYVPADLCFFIRCFVYDNHLKYRNKPLPNDLSGQDLSGFDFTGCNFKYTNLDNTNLVGVILTNTTCGYQKAFLDNIKQHKCYGGYMYEKHLPQDLQSIAVVYSKLKNNTHKANLLHIACGLSQLPFYEKTEFYIKVAYWSSALVQVKQVLGNPYGKQLVCSLQKYLENDANHYCWTTNYPQDKLKSINGQDPHANFDSYLKDFTSGLTKYQCQSTSSWGFNWYKDSITKNIEALAAIYPIIEEKKLQQESYNIARALSKSYQIQQGAFLFNYIVSQHRLMQLKKSVGVWNKNKVNHSACVACLHFMTGFLEQG